MPDKRYPNAWSFRLDLQSRLIAEGHHIPVIFVTAFPEERFRKRATSAGAICFLSKPFDVKSLINCLETALNISRPTSGPG